MRGFTGSGRRAASLAAALLLVATMTGAPVTAQGDGGVVEVFTYWTAGGEAEGLKAAEEVFAAAAPGRRPSRTRPSRAARVSTPTSSWPTGWPVAIRRIRSRSMAAPSCSRAGSRATTSHSP